VEEDSPMRQDETTSEVSKTDTVDRQNTAGDKITKKNPGARIQDRGDNVFSLCVVKLCNE
jgi:hypothetical protein